MPGRGRFRYTLLLVNALAANVASLAFAQAPPPVSITVDARSAGTPLEPVWAYFGYDEVNYTTTPEGQELLRALATANTEKVHVRTHFLFNSGDGTPALKWGSTNIYDHDAQGAAVYDFSIIDQIMDAKASAGVSSLFELGFMPRALSTRPDPYENSDKSSLDSGSFYPPNSYEEWGRLVATWAEHARARYPQDPEHGWLWELWNEPDIGYWQGTVEDYSRLYDYTEAALHSVLPDAVLGGPAIARPHASFLKEFLEHCANGTNAVSGLTGTRLDMVTFHAKGGVGRVDDHVQLDLGNQLVLHRAGFEAVASSAFAAAPIIISEADPDGCAACPSNVARHLDYRNSTAYGAYEVAMMKRSLELAEDVGVDLKGVLTWAFTFPGTPYFAGYRALATNGIHLPVLNAFKLLGALKGRRMPVESSGALPLAEIEQSGVRAQPDVDALATSDGGQIQILVWHYHDDLVRGEPASVTVRVDVPETFAARLLVNHRRVDETHGNAVTVWGSQGNPAAPSDAERAQLIAAMNALELEPDHVVRVEHGVATLTLTLPRFGISLLTLTPSTEPEPLETRAEGCSCRAPRNDVPRSGWLGAALLTVAVAAGRRSRGAHALRGWPRSPRPVSARKRGWARPRRASR